MPGLIRRTLLIGGVAAAAGGVALWRWRTPGADDIAYGKDPRQVMDLTYPRGTGASPVLVMVHGGAFKSGDKSDLAVWPELLDAGIAVVRVDAREHPRQQGRQGARDRRRQRDAGSHS